jgi:hypothetical protein
MEEVRKPINSVCYTPSSEPYGITSLLRIQFPSTNPTELRHDRVLCVILLPRIRF